MALAPRDRGAGRRCRDDRRRVALRLEEVGRLARGVLAGDEHVERAAALGREVVELEVLDVDLLGAERLRDPREHARPVGDVHAHALHRAGILVGLRQQAAPVAAGLADPAGEPARVARLERPLELLDAAAMLDERGAELLGVVQEDVDPDARVRPGHARHVPHGAAGGAERLVAVHAHGARVVEDDVGERVRQVARDRQQPVVGGRVDRHGNGAQRGDEAVQEPVALGLRLRHRRQEPGRPDEELFAAARGAARLRATHRMPADEAHAVIHRGAERGLRRADVGHGRAVGGGRQRLPDPLLEGRHGRGDDHEVGVLDRSDEAFGGLVQRTPLRGDCEELGIRVVADDLLDPRPLRGEAHRGADQPGADDAEPADWHYVFRRMSSASRKARSSDWRAFSLGSQSVM